MAGDAAARTPVTRIPVARIPIADPEIDNILNENLRILQKSNIPPTAHRPLVLPYIFYGPSNSLKLKVS